MRPRRHLAREEPSVFGLLVIAEAVALPAFALFFAPVDATLIAAVLLADVGLAAVGTLLAAMAAASRARELLLPLLFLPLSSRSSWAVSERRSPPSRLATSASSSCTTRYCDSLLGHL